jgi:hypothetical protein
VFSCDSIVSGIVGGRASDLRQELKSYGVAYVDLLDRAVPILKSGRTIDLEHTLDVMELLLDYLGSHPEAKTRHNVLIPAALLHDCGWSEVSEAQLQSSYGDVRPDIRHCTDR